MELELDRTQLNGFETVLDTTVCHEETLEAIVPDAYPDIRTVCDTEGIVLLKRKEAQDGRAECAGSVQAVILYLPDGADGLRRMDVTLPFTCGVDHTGITSKCGVMVMPYLQAIETRLLNPRKVLVRVNLSIQFQVCAPVSTTVCGGVLEPENAGVQQMSERYETCVIACIQEKPFPYSDEVTLPGSKPEAECLLKNRADLRCGEAKVIGNKLIFKGDARVQLLYRSTEGGLCTAEFEIPFSQIMEVSGAGEDATCEIQMVLTDLDCALEEGNGGRTFRITMGLLAQAAVRDMRTIDMLTDVYSTSYDLTGETQVYTLNQLLDHGEKEQTIREILETGTLAREVFDAYATISGVTQNWEGERLTLSADVQVTVLYQTEEGGYTSAVRSIPVSCPLELPHTGVCSCWCSCTSPVYATPTSGGIEVRLPVCFRYTAQEGHKVPSVTAVRLNEDAPRDHSALPSIVLRMVGPGERLWDIAKAYGTTTCDIMQANALEEDAIPEGQLLLIPRKR